VFVTFEGIVITCFYVIPVDCHKVVSVRGTLHVIKSQSMQELMYNYAMGHTSAALEVQVLTL
jgi:hypothetical protein